MGGGDVARDFYTTFSLLEVDEHDEDEGGQQNAAGIKHIPKKAGHLNLGFFAEGLDHKIRRIADVGIGSHENGAC